MNCLICTPGRCGSHWLINLIVSACGYKHIHGNGNEDELPKIGRLLGIQDHAITIQHWRLGLCAGLKAKVVVLIRDPRDQIVSAAHYKADRAGEDFTESLNSMIKKGNSYPWWVDAYLENESTVSHLLVQYEDLHANTAEVLRRVAEYIDYPIDEETACKAVEESTLSKLQAKDDGQKVMYRKGRVSGWHDDITQEQADLIMTSRFREYYQKMGYGK